MNPRWFLRMSRWARHPPSQKRFYVVAVVLGIVLAIYALDRWGMWPDWATVEKLRMRPTFR